MNRSDIKPGDRLWHIWLQAWVKVIHVCKRTAIVDVEIIDGPRQGQTYLASAELLSVDKKPDPLRDK